MNIRLAVIAATALWLSCSSQATEVILVVTTDLTVPSELDRIQIATAGPGGEAPLIIVDLNKSNHPKFPLTLTLTPKADPGTLSVTVVGTKIGAVVVEQRAIAKFVARESHVLVIALDRSCASSVVCAAADTCRQGACVSPAQVGSDLPLWKGGVLPAPADAGVIASVQPIPWEKNELWAGTWHTMALRKGVVFAWGKNTNGQLGEGTSGDRSIRTPVVDLPSVASMTGGGFHSCATSTAGTVFCWGDNQYGQCGTDQSSLRPLQVPTLSNVIHTEASDQHTCAVEKLGQVLCWGRNQLGQLNGTPGPDSVVPLVVPLPSSAVEVGAGTTFSCARLVGGSVWCWGNNSRGQLGSAGTVTGPLEVQVVQDTRQLGVGTDFACALQASGTVQCWGSDQYGQHGAGKAADQAPSKVLGIVDAVQIGSGLFSACVLRKNANVMCWGRGEWGNLGTGQVYASGSGSNQAQDVASLNDVVGIAVGGLHVCARRSSGAISCWGLNETGQLGDGTGDSRNRPVSAAGFP